MQSQPSSFLKSSDMEGLDVLPENSGEGQASLDPSATASGPGMNTLTSELYEPSVDPPQASPGGVAMVGGHGAAACIFKQNPCCLN